MPCLSQGEIGEDYLHLSKAAGPTDSPQQIIKTVLMIVYSIIWLCALSRHYGMQISRPGKANYRLHSV